MTSRIRTAEYVFPGHPDKLCDAIADAIVAAGMAREARALVAAEVAVHVNEVFVTGRIACTDSASIDVDAIVRDVYRTAGYGNGWRPAPEVLTVHNAACMDVLVEGESELRELSDDQSICIGYAVDRPETEYLPVEQWLVRRIARRLYGLREVHPELQLGPDGKVVVLLRDYGDRWELEEFCCSLQQLIGADALSLHRAVRQALSAELTDAASTLRGFSAQLPERVIVNGGGAFEIGGPEGDNGLTGKKLVIDAYGPRVPIGGGAWSGKDFWSPDRAGGLHARRFARLLVELGLAPEAQVTLGWFPGDREARVLDVLAEGVSSDRAARVARFLDLSLTYSGERYAGSRDLVELARWGHLGGEGRAWEAVR
jgi:S-adenosylmethionine synthetase